MNLYVILRRSGWSSPAELGEAAERSTRVGEQMPDDVRWIRSYVLDEGAGSVGTVCIYEARARKRSASTRAAPTSGRRDHPGRRHRDRPARSAARRYGVTSRMGRAGPATAGPAAAAGTGGAGSPSNAHVGSIDIARDRRGAGRRLWHPGISRFRSVPAGQGRCPAPEAGSLHLSGWPRRPRRGGHRLYDTQRRSGGRRWRRAAGPRRLVVHGFRGDHVDGRSGAGRLPRAPRERLTFSNASSARRRASAWSTIGSGRGPSSSQRAA